MWRSGEVVLFVYNGSYWELISKSTATTTYYGLTKLSSSVTSTSTTLAATASAVKAAYDRQDFDEISLTTALALSYGGTGATTAAAARTNLGITCTSLYSGTLTTGSTTFNYGSYKGYVIVGQPWFLEGHGYEYITNRLLSANVPTKRSGATWANTTIKNIITNEKYCGDCLFQKTFISDPIQHTSSRNRGQLPQYYIEDVLPAIIPREEWQAAQELVKRHAGNGLKQSEEYPFTNMLVCPYCGKKYGSYTSAGHNRELLNWYRCKSRHDHTAVEVPGMMYTPPSRHRVDNPSPAMVAYREKYNHPTPPRQMICSDIRIPFAYPQKVYVRAWNQLVSKKTRYQPILQRTLETTDNALTRLRAKEMIDL